MSRPDRRTSGERSAPRSTTRAGSPPGNRTGTALELLDRACLTLLAACRADTTTDRYINAHLGALRAAAALLATRSHRSRGQVSSVWDDVTAVAPEMAEWAAYFAVVGRRRAQVESGEVRVGTRESDDTLRAAETFVAIVHTALGLPASRGEPPLSAVSFAGSR